MALPKIDKPIFTETFPNSKSKFTFRPFDVLEQKNVLIAAQGGTENELLENLVTLVDNCTFNKHDFRNRRVADFEKAFLSIRSKSVGELIEVSYRCLNTHDDGTVCNQRNTKEVYFLKDVIFTDEPDSIIKVNETIKIKLKPISIQDALDSLDFNDNNSVFRKIEWVSEGEEIYTEFTEEEFDSFAKDIPIPVVEKITDYFNNQSVASLDINTACKKCGNKSTIEIRGAVNFFD